MAKKKGNSVDFTTVGEGLFNVLTAVGASKEESVAEVINGMLASAEDEGLELEAIAESLDIDMDSGEGGSGGDDGDLDFLEELESADLVDLVVECGILKKMRAKKKEDDELIEALTEFSEEDDENLDTLLDAAEELGFTGDSDSNEDDEDEDEDDEAEDYDSMSKKELVALAFKRKIEWDGAKVTKKELNADWTEDDIIEALETQDDE